MARVHRHRLDCASHEIGMNCRPLPSGLLFKALQFFFTCCLEAINRCLNRLPYGLIGCPGYLQHPNILLSLSTVIEALRSERSVHLSASAVPEEATQVFQEVSARSRRLNRLLKRLEALSEASVVVLADFCELEDCWLSNRGLRLSRSPCTSSIKGEQATQCTPIIISGSPMGVHARQKAR